MGQTLPNGIYLPAEGERNCYDGLEGNWRSLDGLISTVSGKASATHTHGSITNDGKLATANRVLVTDGNKVISLSGVTDTELSYLSGVTSAIQTQLNSKAGLSDNNTFSGDNSFSKTISSSHSIVLSSRYANVQLGAIPSTDQALLRFQCNDKDDDSLCYFRQFYQSSGTSTFQLFVRNKFANGTLSTSGTYDYAYLGIGIESDKSPFAFLKGTFKPYTTGIYDLGSSSYQWNNLYAKNYFYNGVAWGLDKVNTWTDENTYTATINYQSSYTLGNPPQSAAAQVAIKVLDTAGTNYLAQIAAYQDTSLSGLRFTIRDKFDSNGFSPSGSNRNKHLYFVQNTSNQGYLQWDGYTNNNVSPIANNTYNLGSSSYQWNNLYAKNYFYNGTAWGLDKANTWTALNSYSAGIELVGNRYAYILPEFSVNYSGISLLTNSFGKTVKIGSYTTNASNNIVLDTTIGFLELAAGQGSDGNIVRIQPRNGTFAELGTSNNKWKTLNGLNPGALSLPDFSAEFDVSGQIVPPTGENQISINWGRNTFTPSVNGWLSVRIHKATSIEIYRSIRSSYCAASRVESADDICVCSPVVAGVEYTIKIQATQFSSDYDHFRLSPCLGNV